MTTLEIHLTVDPRGRDERVLAPFAAARGCRFLQIELADGVFPRQPMLTWRLQGDVDAALSATTRIADEIAAIGMSASRVKIEADMAEVSAASAIYFEAHYRVDLAPEQLPALEELARRLGVHRSRNAQSRRGDRERRFLTARAATRTVAGEFFDRVETALRSEGWPLIDVHREAVLFDSNLGLDAGWTS